MIEWVVIPIVIQKPHLSHTVFDLITAPAPITAPLDFLLYITYYRHLTIFFLTFYFISLIIAHLTIFWHQW